MVSCINHLAMCVRFVQIESTSTQDPITCRGMFFKAAKLCVC